MARRRLLQRVVIYFFSRWLLLSVVLSTSHAEVVLDGSVGPSGALPGPNFDISADLGTQAGGNLFHSFRSFNLNSTESATFSGPNSVDNILSRVTGGGSSTIDGLLRSTIPGADLYFINPAGVMFGPNARLDVQGSFHVTTADFIRLGEEGRFAATAPESSVLTVAPPEAFGFLGENPAGISIKESTFQLSPSETFSVIGGDVDIAGGPSGAIIAPDGQVNIASIASAGEVSLDNVNFEIDYFERLGEIRIAEDAVIFVGGQGGGSIVIRGGRFEIDHSTIVADNFIADTSGEKGGDNIDIALKDNLIISNGARILSTTRTNAKGADIAIKATDLSIDSADIVTDTIADGQAGDLSIEVGSLRISGTAVVRSRTGLFTEGEGVLAGEGRGGNLLIKATESISVFDPRSAIANQTSGPGNAGNIYIETPVMIVDDEALISASAQDKGNAGNITVNVDNLILADGGVISSSGGGFIEGGDFFPSGGEGKPGVISINATESISVSGHANDGLSSRIDSNTLGGSDAGSILIRTGLLTLDDNGIVQSITIGTGRGGGIEIHADQLQLANNAAIDASTFGPGRGGIIEVTATDTVSLSGARISANSESAGQGGSVTIKAENIDLIDRAAIASASLGSGDGGNVDINARSVDLRGGSVITTDTFSTGEGGDLKVQAVDVILTGTDNNGENVQSSQLSVSTQGTEPGSGDAGDLFLSANFVQLLDGARINATTSGAGNGGNLDINAETAVLKGHGGRILSAVSAQAQQDSSGNAGNISFSADTLEVLDGGRIDASTLGLGKGGNLEIDARRIRVEGLTQGFSSEIPLQSEISVLSGLVSENGAGNLTLNVDRLEARDGGVINASTLGPGRGGNLKITAEEIILHGNEEITFLPKGLAALTRGSGQGGTLTIDASDIELQNGGTISSESLSEAADAGESGDIAIFVGEDLQLQNGSQITVETAQANAGDIEIQAKSLVLLRDKSAITTSVADGGGNGGNIIIDPEFVVLDGASEIVANALEGRGGNIEIIITGGGSFFQSPDSVVRASSQFGVDGSVVIDSPDTDISGSIAVLPESFLNVSSQLSERCAARTGGPQSSFVVVGRGGVSLAPEGPAPSSYGDKGAGSASFSQNPKRTVTDSRLAAHPGELEGGKLQVWRLDCGR